MSFEQPLPHALSPSRLADFQACPRRYQLASVERIAQPASYATAKGRYIHFIFERLLGLAAHERTPAAARGFLNEAREEIFTQQVRTDISWSDDLAARLDAETEVILDRYFIMEDPQTVDAYGVELRLSADLSGTPLFGILDRLDRDEDGQLVIVDYKTGKVPSRTFDSQTFANAELYAVLCEAALGETPTAIRLLYVAHATTLERAVTPVVIRARADAAQRAWNSIKHYYDDGEFPPQPSARTCRLCAYQERCRSDGVAVVTS